MNCIISSYLTSSIDHQRGIIKENDDLEYISTWYYSVLNMNLHPIILHENLSDGFISSFPDAKFIKCKQNPGYQLHDYRWLLFGMYLQQSSDDNIFFTDISDVKIINNPFLQTEYNNDTLFCGDELCTLNSWPMLHVTEEIRNLHGYENFAGTEKQLLNCGIVGGSRNVMLRYLRYMARIIEIVKNRRSNTTVDIPIYNYVIYKYFKNIKHGFPVNSIFRRQETRDDVWFIHK